MDKKSDVKIINDFIQDQYALGKSSGTIHIYRRIIQEFLIWLDTNGGNINSLTRVDIQQYIQYLEKKGNSAVTIENKFAAISNLVKYLGQVNILLHIRRPEYRKSRNIAPKSLDRNERNRILREVEQSGNLRNIAIVYLFFYTGLRVSELASLNQTDVILGTRSGTVIVQNGKGNISRKVPLPAEARLHLKNYLNKREDNLPALFLSNYRQRISVRSIQHILEQFGVHPHELRHTYCRGLVSAGIDIAIVAELAGHLDINVTRRYAQPTTLELEQAIEKAFY